MSRIVVAALCLMAVLAPVTPAAAVAEPECEGFSDEGPSGDNLDGPFLIDVAGAAYVDVRALMRESYLFAIYVFLESNGHAGLQRGGSTPYSWLFLSQRQPDDGCGDWRTPPDQLLL